jgi:radical SAM superfamily enzyme YgiQ (UPF0313 family)
MGDFMSSRGCSYKCLFCFYDTYFEFYEDEKRIRYYSPERCISEMDELTKRYNLTFWKFHDSDFFLRSEEKLGELLELYNTRIDLPFVCNTNANTVTNKKVALFNNANCKSVSMGVESGSERIRNEVLNKRVKNEKIIESIALLKDAGIRVCTSNMLGLPDETEDDIRETIQLNRNAAPTLAEPTYFYPFRGTKLGDLCYEKGYVKEHKGNLLNLRNHCVIEMPQISLDTLNGLFRTFPLYMNLPKWLDPIIRLAENHDNVGNKVYRTLHQIVQNKINECLNENQ